MRITCSSPNAATAFLDATAAANEWYALLPFPLVTGGAPGRPASASGQASALDVPASPSPQQPAISVFMTQPLPADSALRVSASVFMTQPLPADSALRVSASVFMHARLPYLT